MEAPVWLFSGPEIGERTAAVQKRKAALQKNGASIDSYSFYVPDTPITAILDVLQNGSLFADARFVVIKNAETLKKKDDIQLLTQWITEAGSAASAYLVFISDDISIDKKLESLIPKGHKTIYWELFENQKHEWIRRFFAQSRISIDKTAISTLLELVENNTAELKKACFRISLFVNPEEPLSGETIEKLLSHTKEESVFTLFDALSNQNVEYALSIQQKLLLSKESSPISIIAGLSYCFRRLHDWHYLAAQQQCTDANLKRIGFTSKKIIEQYRRASALWNDDAVCRIMALLAETDIALRSSLPQDMHSIVIENCLSAIMLKNGSPLQQYHTQYRTIAEV